MDSLRAVCAEKGVFLRQEAFKLGIDDKTLGRLRQSGFLVRVRHGAYAFGDVWEKLDERGRHALRFRAAARASRQAVAASHVTAMLEHVPDYWGLDLSRPHLTRLDGRGAGRTSGLHQHRGVIRDGDLTHKGTYAVTAPACAGLELVTVASTEAALVSIDAVLKAGLCSVQDIWARYEAGIDRWPHTLRANIVLRLMDPRIESVGESRTLYMLWNGGLPLPQPQFDVYAANGTHLGRVDFAWPELGVFLEFDGMIKYQRLLKEGESASDVVVREKLREERICRATGWRCVRITWADLQSPARTIAMIREVLAAAA
jgi:hypothetical protein